MGCTGNDSVKQNEDRRNGIDGKEQNDKILNVENEDYKKDIINLQKKIEENQEIKKENEEMKRKNEEIQQKYEEMQKEMQEMIKRNEAIQKENEKIQKEKEEILKENDKIQKEKEKIQKEKEELQKENEKKLKEKEAIKEENEQIQKENEKIQKEKEKTEKEIKKEEENKVEAKEEIKEEKKAENTNSKPEETKKEEEKKETQKESNSDGSTDFNENDYPLFQSNFYEKFIQNFKKILVEKEEDGTIKTHKIYATIDHNKKTTSIIEIEIEEKGKEIKKHLNKSTLNGNSLKNIQTILEKYNEKFHVDIKDYLKIDKTTDVFIRAENFNDEDIGKEIYFIYDKKNVTITQIKTYRTKKGSGRTKKSYFGMGSDGVVEIYNKNTNDFLNYKEQSYSALDNNGYNINDFSDYQQKSLIIHNKYRKEHHVPELQLNKELCEISKKYAEHLAKNNLFEHSWARFKGAPMGENLFMAHGFKPPAEDAVKDWYSEIKFYNFKKGTGNGIGHFTQVVWKNTKYMGVSMAQKGKDYYVVANYFPAGNIDGTFTKNVLPK